MLIEFRVENHRSLRDEQVLTMEAGRVGDEDDPRPRSVPGNPDKLLPAAVLYGANASGKSNVLSALAFMRDAVLFSHRLWSPEEGVPREPFAWGAKRAEPSLFEVTLLLDAVRYQYGFVASDESFSEEWLFAWPNGKKQVWFERDGSVFEFGEHLKGENRLIRKLTRANALFLSSAAQNKHDQLMRVYSWFANLRSRVPPSSPYSRFSRESDFLLVARMLENDAAGSQQSPPFPLEPSADSWQDAFRSLLKSADMGIVDWRVDGNRVQDGPRASRFPRFQLKHQSTSGDAWLPLEEESRGTQALFWLAPLILRAIQRGATILVDELDASMHPSLAQAIVRQFNDPATNPRNAQLLFTTHDTNLLGTTTGDAALRRDQVWLTEKDAEGATVLYPLTDFKPRKAENLERGYLQGRYGAIPFLGDLRLLGSDGP